MNTSEKIALAAMTLSNSIALIKLYRDELKGKESKAKTEPAVNALVAREVAKSAGKLNRREWVPVLVAVVVSASVLVAQLFDSSPLTRVSAVLIAIAVGTLCLSIVLISHALLHLTVMRRTYDGFTRVSKQIRELRYEVVNGEPPPPDEY